MKNGVVKSFFYAFDGIKYAFKTQPNFKVHAVIACSVILLACTVGLNSLEWFIVLLAIGLGLVIELINTSIETTIDLITKEIHPLAKIAKDTAAAAMLVYAISAGLVGLILFLPKLWRFI